VVKEGGLGVDAERSGVRRRHLLQIGGRAGRAEREMGGGGGSVPRGERKMGERGGPGCGTTAWTTGSGWLWAARSEAVARAHGGGGLANREGGEARAKRCG
jgi:hypothetical protein